MNPEQSFIIGAAGGEAVLQSGRMSNRHGMIAGATGSGKTVTLQILAESFSRMGVPVFAADIKGDLSGLAVPGTPHPKVSERLQRIPLEGFQHRPYPVVFWDIQGKTGHPVRTTISEMGPLLLANLLDLNETQEGILYAAFRIADEEGMLMLDLKDMRSMLNWMRDNAAALRGTYGNISAASVGAIISAGIIPAGLEMMDRLSVQAVEAFNSPGYPPDAEAVLLCELDGGKAEVAEQMAAVKAILDHHQATSVAVSANETERLRLWQGRKNAFPAVGRIRPDYYCMDGTIPRGELPRVLADIREASQRCGLAVANVFHAGDGNLHPLILYDANQPGELEQAEKLGAEILSMCIAAGGTVTGEHGVGMEKIDSMCEQFPPAELEQFHALKKAFDPDGLLNPGKAVPTLHRCAELGAMHVHDGKLPFPELPRF